MGFPRFETKQLIVLRHNVKIDLIIIKKTDDVILICCLRNESWWRKTGERAVKIHHTVMTSASICERVRIVSLRFMTSVSSYDCLIMTSAISCERVRTWSSHIMTSASSCERVRTASWRRWIPWSRPDRCLRGSWSRWESIWRRSSWNICRNSQSGSSSVEVK